MYCQLILTRIWNCAPGCSGRRLPPLRWRRREPGLCLWATQAVVRIRRHPSAHWANPVAACRLVRTTYVYLSLLCAPVAPPRPRPPHVDGPGQTPAKRTLRTRRCVRHYARSRRVRVVWRSRHGGPAGAMPADGTMIVAAAPNAARSFSDCSVSATDAWAAPGGTSRSLGVSSRCATRPASRPRCCWPCCWPASWWV